MNLIERHPLGSCNILHYSDLFPRHTQAHILLANISEVRSNFVKCLRLNNLVIKNLWGKPLVHIALMSSTIVSLLSL